MSAKADTLNTAVDKSAIPDDTKTQIKTAVTKFYSASVFDAKRVALRAKAERDRESILKKLAASEAATAKNRADLLESYETLLKQEASDEAVMAKFPKVKAADSKEAKGADSKEAKAADSKEAKAADSKEAKVKEPKEKKVQVRVRVRVSAVSSSDDSSDGETRAGA